jgi:3-oxoacyl-[acyl-carrier-protein] synthase-1
MRVPSKPSSIAPHLRAVGLVSAVGLTARAAAAALRAGILRFQEIPFHDAGGNPIIGAPVPMIADGCQGLRRFAVLLSAAIQDAEEQLGGGLPKGLPLIVGLPEEGRPGTPSRLERDLVGEVEANGGWDFDRTTSRLIPTGNTAGLRAVRHARMLLEDPKIPAVVVAGVDSHLNSAALAHLESGQHLKTEDNPDGVIPGEGAAALVLTRPWEGDRTPPLLEIPGLGIRKEEATPENGGPNTGRGLADAIRDALADAGVTSAATHFRLSDVAGERWQFSETNYAMSRTIRERHADYPLWLTAESFGELGAAAGPALLAIAAIAFEKGYAPGPGALCQTGTMSGDRAVAFVRPVEN